MSHTKPFTSLTKDDSDIAGGKGASLGEMTNAKIPVPPGFVVCADAFERFAEETDLTQEIDAILKTVDTNATHTVEEASENIRSLILAKEMPDDLKTEIQKAFKELNTPYVAVRSSATAEDGRDHAWAGQLDSFLNTTEETLLENVRRCWASLFTPRAIFYRFEKDLHETFISVAVVVQKMVESEISGIAFSVHPVTEDYNQMIIEAGLGLGEAIVSGQITPDSYVVTKDPKEIIDINVATQTRALYRKKSPAGEEPNEWRDLGEEGEKQVLTGEQILELSDIIETIENHYNFPCDIEWAYEDKTFYIVQSRPITTLGGGVEKLGKDNLIGEVIAKDWYVDWDADLPLTSVSITSNAYFSKIPKLFGVEVTDILLTFRKGKIIGYLDVDDHQKFAHALLKKVDTKERAEEWAENFKMVADEATEQVSKLTPEKILGNFDRCVEIFDEYGAWQIATKAVYNVLPANLNPQIAKILEEARLYSEKFYKELDIFNELVAYISDKEEGYTIEAVSALTKEEFETYIKTNFLPDLKRLEDRYRCCAMYLHFERESHIFACNELEKIEQSLRAEYSGNAIKGTTAYKGKVAGVCRLVTEFEGVEIKEGEVLVTVMTNPNFVPLMKKATAIVTDGGGMLCHAAIVSRELEIPCVIGTKIATQVLKDGDEVEVDADNGIVKLIS